MCYTDNGHVFDDAPIRKHPNWRQCRCYHPFFEPYQKKVFTITSDNGKEFTNHDRIAKELKPGFYFAHPYHALKRGLNENTNGLIRQYFPKTMGFENITNDQIQMVMNRLNSLPRKRLNFATPNDMLST